MSINPPKTNDNLNKGSLETIVYQTPFAYLGNAFVKRKNI